MRSAGEACEAQAHMLLQESGAPPAELCEQNAAVAEAADAPQLALAWRTAAVMAMAPPPETAAGPITPVGGIDALVAPVLVSLLNHHAARGDPQTCASLVLVLRFQISFQCMSAQLFEFFR